MKKLVLSLLVCGALMGCMAGCSVFDGGTGEKYTVDTGQGAPSENAEPVYNEQGERVGWTERTVTMTDLFNDGLDFAEIILIVLAGLGLERPARMGAATVKAVRKKIKAKKK